MNSIDDKTLVLLMSKVTNFDRDKTLKLSKKLSVDYEKAERIVNVLQNVILTGHLNDLDSIEVNENQKRIIEKLLKKPTKPEKISKKETVKIQNGFVTHGCTGTKTMLFYLRNIYSNLCFSDEFRWRFKRQEKCCI